jgi:hypothetical protein
MSRNQLVRKLRRKRLLTLEEFRLAYKDAYDYLKSRRANKDLLNICRRLQEEHQCLFPEVTMRQAAFLTDFPEKKILTALRQWKLRGRVVWGDSFIPLIDLWEFYNKNRR